MKRDNEAAFEQQAQSILSYLKSDTRYSEHLPRPFFIEFTGSPSSGKTTCIIELDKFLRRQGFRVFHPQEGAEAIRHIPRTTPNYNLRTGLYALSILIDESYGHLYDVVIFDRCIFDAYCWMMYWEDKNKLTSDEVIMIQSFFTSRFWVDKIDIAYFVTCSPEVAMERELRIALTQKLGETTSPKSVAGLIKRYQTAYKTLHATHPQIHLIDTTELGEQEMVELVATKTLNLLEQKAKQKFIATKK